MFGYGIYDFQYILEGCYLKCILISLKPIDKKVVCELLLHELNDIYNITVKRISISCDAKEMFFCVGRKKKYYIDLNSFKESGKEEGK